MAKFMNFKGDYEGLKTSAAEKKLSMYGENLFRETEDRSFKAYQPFLSLAFLALILAFAVFILLFGNIASGIACIFLAAVYSVVMSFAQRYCNEKLSSRKLAAEMKYRVIRNGEPTLIAARYIVPDDIIIVQGGETVPADAHILEASGALADESRFTGDNKPALKRPGSDSKSDGLKETCIYGGTRLLQGSLIARVFATGEDTLCVRSREKRSKLPDPDLTVYERAADKITSLLTLAGVVFAGVSFLLGMLSQEKYDTASGILFSIAYFLCFMPPCASLFIRLYAVKGAKKIDAKGAAFKNMGVIDKLNSLTAVVIDKSYIVAPNKLEVAGIYSKNRELMQNVTVLACERETQSEIEQAFLLDAALAGRDIKWLHSNQVIKSYHYNDNDRVGGNLCSLYGQRLLCIKGSPDKVLSMCDTDADTLFDIQQRAAALAKRGLEIWASAYAILPEGTEAPDSLYRISYTYMGMTAFMSATRDVIPLAVQGCRRAGVKVIMTTPDSPETAASMGKKIGLKEEGMITGEQINEAAYLNGDPDYTAAEIFSQVTSSQKIEIINGLKAAGETVAVLSNSDSQYEAVKAADLGITSLNLTTGSIYEASGLIMTDDSFGTIVEVIREARQIRHNIKKCLSLFISSVTAMILLALFDAVFSVGVMTPMLTALVTVFAVPLLALGYIGNTADIKTEMKASGFINKGAADKSFFIGSIVSGAVIAAVTAVYLLLCLTGADRPSVSASALIILTLSFAVLSLLISGKSTPFITLIKEGSIPSKSIGTAAAVSVCSVVLTLLPFVSSSFGFSAPGFLPVLFAILLSIAANAWIEIKKYFFGKD